MKKKISTYFLVLTVLFALSGNSNALFAQEGSPLEGRWDITIHAPGKDFPSWLEVRHSGLKTLVGQFVSTGGSARPISKVNFAANKMSFSIPPQWERDENDMKIEGTLQGDSLVGTGVSSSGKTFNWTGHRAPRLHRDKDPLWGEPIELFNGKDLTGWHATGENQWIAQDGILRSLHKGSNLDYR